MSQAVTETEREAFRQEVKDFLAGCIRQPDWVTTQEVGEQYGDDLPDWKEAIVQQLLAEHLLGEDATKP